MNSLSWLIYGVQIFDSLRVLLFVVAICLLAPMAFIGFIGAISTWDKDMDSLRTFFAKNVKRVAIAGVFCLVAAALTPTRQTMLLIAGSEIGERVASSSNVKDIVDPGIDLLKSWIKKETQNLAKDG